MPTRTGPLPASTSSTPNRVLYSDDCLNVLNDELAPPSGSVDLIYLDPPFNSKSIYNLPFVSKDKDARPVEAFADTWTWDSKEDDLLQELSNGPQSRYLADVVTLAGHLSGKSRGDWRRTWSTWRCGSWRCAGSFPQRGPYISIATTRPATTSRC